MVDKEKIFTETIITGRNGDLEVKPTFTKEGVYFHPLPKDMQEKYTDGDVVDGYFGFSHPTGKRDKRNVEIFIRYFVPTKLH